MIHEDEILVDLLMFYFATIEKIHFDDSLRGKLWEIRWNIIYCGLCGLMFHNNKK